MPQQPMTNRQKVLRDIKQYFKERREQDGDLLVAEMFDQYLTALPMTEKIGGHIHEAAVTAMERMARSLPKTAAAIGRHASFRSGDKRARRAGKGKVTKRSGYFLAEASIDLPFAAKVENGQVITVIAPGGPKYKNGIGKLYGRRRKGQTGMLMWFDESGKHFAKFRVPKGAGDGVGAFGDAAEAVASKAESLGWTRN